MRRSPPIPTDVYRTYFCEQHPAKLYSLAAGIVLAQVELEYFRHGGILQYVLRKTASEKAA